MILKKLPQSMSYVIRIFTKKCVFKFLIGEKSSPRNTLDDVTIMKFIQEDYNSTIIVATQRKVRRSWTDRILVSRV